MLVSVSSSGQKYMLKWGGGCGEAARVCEGTRDGGSRWECSSKRAVDWGYGLQKVGVRLLAANGGRVCASTPIGVDAPYGRRRSDLKFDKNLRLLSGLQCCYAQCLPIRKYFLKLVN